MPWWQWRMKLARVDNSGGVFFPSSTITNHQCVVELLNCWTVVCLLILLKWVVVVCRSFVVPHLWELCDGITFVILELHFWDLVHCLLISFCFGSEILKKIGPPQPQKKPKNTQKKTYGFSRWDNLPTLWVRRLGFGTVFTNIILLWIRNFEENLTTPTPKKYPKTLWIWT